MATLVNILNTGGGKRSVVQANGTNTIVVAGNNTVSNLTSNSTEVVISAAITKVVYTNDSASYWTLARGANNIGNYNGTGFIDYQALGLTLNSDAVANVVCTLAGGTNGTIIIEFTKVSHF